MSQKVSRSDKLSFKAQCAIVQQNFIGTKIEFEIQKKLFSGIVVWETKGTFHVSLKETNGSDIVKIIKKANTLITLKCPKELSSIGYPKRIKINATNLLGTPIERISRCV
ncbi:MAG TPA: ribonuclease P protein subunit [Candidatus Woesearchaeota archaeon]|nr:ribonuclease P protein subunit [Candidatus Woesearchaeota archaeon]